VLEDSKYTHLAGAPDIAAEGRNVVVLESKDVRVRDKFKRVALKYRDRIRAAIVGVKDQEMDIENDNYDNCYVIGPRGARHRYLVPKNGQIIEYITEEEIENIFRVASLPRAIVLRQETISGEQFTALFGDYTVYVALVDTSAISYTPEFGYQFRDWIANYTE
jgi:hypothetical protein